jgi:RNA polymerase sigma-70 factor (ECF subfamily)
MWMEPTSEHLMAEMGWVRRLARALVRDDAAADDVAQDTWVVAAAHRPDEDRPLRPWLATVVRNLAHTRRRGEARRDAREADYDDARRVATPEELVERVELQRAVAGEVIALAEPYRSTVLLHFFEGLSSVDIARRLGIPDSTVRRRLMVALDQLRAALQKRDDQPKRGWLAALAPLAELPGPRVAMGVVAMKKLIAVAIVLVLLVAGAVWWKLGRRGGDAGAPATAAATGQTPRPVGERPAIGLVPAWIAQPEAPAQRIAGHVVSGGAPVPGATVRLGLEVDFVLLQPVAEVTSAADGSFDFGAQPAARFTVSASAPDLAAAMTTVANADSTHKNDQLVLELGECRSRLFGMVVDASGGGITKARVQTVGLSGIESDATGHYSVCLPAAPSFGTPALWVRVEADGYGTIQQQVLYMGELHQDFTLVPEAELVGRVVTADDHPVAGARVVASPDPMEGPHHVANGWADSDRDGHFRIAGLAAGHFHVSASAPQLVTIVPVTAIARATKTSHELRVVVSAAARVRGRVVMNEKPVAGVPVATMARPGSHPGEQPIARCVSQADGSFVLDRVPFGPTSFVAAPYEVRAPKSLDVKTAVVDGVTLEVGKLATLRGHVTRKDKPVAGVDVQCMQQPALLAQAKSDATGAYVLEGFAGGEARCAALDVHGKAFANMRPLQVTAGQEQTVDFTLDWSGEVKGTVVDETGKPVVGVYVRMDIDDPDSDDQCEAMSDGTGQFDCPMLTGGRYRPTVAPSPGARQPFAAADGERLPTIDVPKDGVASGVKLAIKYERMAIAGNVVDDTGAIVADVHVEAISTGRMQAGSMDFPSATSDASGRFTIGNLARGVYNLHAHAADGSETEVLNIVTGTDAVTIKLARPGAIEGTLVGFSTTPTVETMTLTTDLHIGGTAIVDGATFSQIGLPPGRYTVEAKAGGEVDGAAVDVKSGETAHVTLTSRGMGKVEGTVTEFGTKTPVAAMRCDGNLSMAGQMSGGPPDESRQAFTDAAGHFVLTAPVGRVRVFCFVPNGGPLSVAGTDVDVAAGAMPHVDLFAVRPTFGASPGNFGFDITPIVLPLTVNRVDPHGPAAAAGIAAGDHIVTIDGASLQGVLPQGATFLLANHHSGSTVTLGLERGGAPRVVKFVIGS